MTERYGVTRLLCAIRYQIERPEVTTMGPCPDCGGPSRGGSECADCLACRLDALTLPGLGLAYVEACSHAHEIEREIMGIRELSP
jgi:hypothetical protein